MCEPPTRSSTPFGDASVRKGEYLEIETVQAPEPYIVRSSSNGRRPRSSTAGVALELDLQGGHPGARYPLVRDPRHGHGPLRLRRVRQGLALGRPTTPTTGTGASPISMATGRSSSATTPRKRRPSEPTRSSISRIFAGAARRHRPGARREGHRAGESVELRIGRGRQSREEEPFSDRRAYAGLSLALDR